MPLYFAYGSNMDRAAMAARCPASRAIGSARLVRHRFVLMREGYASVVRDPGRDVHGLLWDLALRDVAALDRYEAIDSGLYHKITQAVVTPEGPRRALVYVGSNDGGGRPPRGYIEAILRAAREAGLPPRYIDEVRRHLCGRP